jgi:tetratricopeptide (TPR) repeat protein
MDRPGFLFRLTAESMFPMNHDYKYVVATMALLLTASGAFAQTAPGPVAPGTPVPADGKAKTAKIDYASLDRGDRAFEDRIYEVALKYYKTYRDSARASGPVEPDFVHATTKIAETALCLGRIDEAKKAIDEFDQSKFPVREDYRDAYLYIKAAVTAAGGNVTEARDQLRQAMPGITDPIEKIKAILLLGNIGIQLGDWDGATACFKQIPAPAGGTDPRFKALKAGADLGQLKVELLSGRLDKAGEFIASLEKNPATDARLVKLYQVLFLLKKNTLNEALAVYKGIENSRPLQADFDWWLVANALVDELKKADRAADAKPILNQTQLFAITARDKVVAQLRLADTLVSLNDLAGAIEILDRFRTTNPDLPELYQTEFRIADLFRAKQEYKKALLYYGMVVDVAGVPVAFRYKAMFNMGLCQREQQEYKDSAALFRKTADLASTPSEKADALMQAADSLLRKREFLAEAAQLFGQVAREYPALPQGEDARRNEGRVFFDDHKFAEAINSYDLYLKSYPAGKGRYLETIKIERGIALRESGDLAGALKAFTDFIGEYRGGSPDLPRALEEAYKTALQMGDTAAASRFVSEITDKYANSPYYPKALYWKAHIAFKKGEGAEAAAKSYLQQFDNREDAVDVCFWLADWYNSQKRHAEALSLFIRVKTDHSASPEAPLASYEAAKTCLYQGEYSKGISFLEELEKHPGFKADGALRYKSWLLKGDMLLSQQKFDEAAAAFGKAAEESAAGTRSRWVAKGRLGEALLAKALKTAEETSGKEVEKVFAQALQQLDEALDDVKSIPADIRDTLWLDRAKVLERMGNLDEAFKAYYDIVLAYEEDLVKNNKQRDWRVLESAAFEAARLAIRLRNYDQADRIYSRIIRMELPLKKEAQERKDKLLDELRQRDKERQRENGGEAPKVN